LRRDCVLNYADCLRLRATSFRGGGEGGAMKECVRVCYVHVVCFSVMGESGRGKCVRVYNVHKGAK
jgi:hypothetical protein